MKISFWKAMGLVSLVADELTKAGADNKISFEESLAIAKNLGTAVGLAFDDEGAGLVVSMVTDFINAAADGKITIAEMILITESLCSKLGIDFDKTGFNV